MTDLHVRDEQGRKRGLHGTPSGYTNGKCRCDACTWAWASRRRGDDPVEPIPKWFDQWVGQAGAL